MFYLPTLYSGSVLKYIKTEVPYLFVALSVLSMTKVRKDTEPLIANISDESKCHNNKFYINEHHVKK